MQGWPHFRGPDQREFTARLVWWQIKKEGTFKFIFVLTRSISYTFSESSYNFVLCPYTQKIALLVLISLPAFFFAESVVDDDQFPPKKEGTHYATWFPLMS